MLYSIKGKCYINISPRIYVEVIVSKDGKITPTKNKIEVGERDVVQQTTIENELKKLIEIEKPKPKVEEQKVEEYKSKFKRRK